MNNPYIQFLLAFLFVLILGAFAGIWIERRRCAAVHALRYGLDTRRRRSKHVQPFFTMFTGRPQKQ